VVHIFRSGDLVYGAEATDREVADELIAALQSIAAGLQQESDGSIAEPEPAR
jgi:hypothetical protein